jgi:hypothetical protein
MEDGLNFFFGVLLTVLVASVLLLVLAFTIRACVSDARRRGKSPVPVCAAVILFFPWGLISWLIFRPDPLNKPTGKQPFRLENYHQ